MSAGFTKILTIGSSIVGISATSTLGGYKWSMKTIKDVAKECLPESETNERIWKKAKQNWDKKKTGKKFFNSLEKNTWDGLKDKCTSYYKDTYSSWFKNENKELLNEINEICVLNVRDAIEDQKLIIIPTSEQNSYQNETIFQNKFNGDHKNLIEDDEKLWSIVSKGNGSWKELESWCGKAYDSKYIGANKKWDLINKYCTKP